MYILRTQIDFTLSILALSLARRSDCSLSAFSIGLYGLPLTGILPLSTPSTLSSLLNTTFCH